MRKFIIPITALLSLCLLSQSCQVKTPKAAEQRETWIESLNDSIALYQKQTEEVRVSLEEALRHTAELAEGFEYVKRPREVEGYFIRNGWSSRYPLTSTGLIARITEDMHFELIAALSGAHFNEIAVTAAGRTVSSGVVPHDQALNYRAGALNTVCFSGEKADSVASFIFFAANAATPARLAFLEGKPTGSLSIPEDVAAMIASTWRFYEARISMINLEKELPRLAGKISACRRILDARDEPLDLDNTPASPENPDHR